MAWMQTLFGTAFELNNPNPADVDPAEIAASLSGINRYLNHTREPWNVAEHSLLCEALLPDGTSATTRLLVLLHDAHEAYTGDMPTPVKRALMELNPSALVAFKTLQEGIQRAVHARLNLPIEPDAADLETIKAVDILSLTIERRDLMAPCPRDWLVAPAPASCWPRLRVRPAMVSAWAFERRLAFLRDLRSTEG